MPIHLVPKKCYLCESFEIVNESCTKCHKPYCALDASRINPALYCDECMRDVVIEETTYTRTDTDYAEESDTLNTYTAKCKQIIFKGIDWMFACQKLCELPDEQLKPILEMHRAFVYQLESELMVRAVRKSHQQVTMNHPAAKKILSLNKTVKIKTVKQAKVAAASISMEDLVKLALKMGITSGEQLQQFINQGKVQ